MGSAIKSAASDWLARRTRAGATKRGVVAFTLFGAGNFIGLRSTAIAVLVFVIVLVPVLGFTISQIVLTMKGRRMASSVDDVRILKQADAIAFAQFFAAIVRKMRARDVYPVGDLSLTDGGQGTDVSGPIVEATPGIGASRFWFSLEPVEQADLARVAQLRKFDMGVTLWRQSEHADQVVVIRSGRTLIFVSDAHGEKLIAVRQEGDIVGERAALREGQRSATVVTASTVQAYVIATSAFYAVAGRHPHILEVLESQIYDRLTERPFAQVGVRDGNPLSPAEISLAPAELSFMGENCSICLVDVAAFDDSSRTDPDRRSVRDAMYKMLADAFRAAGIPWLDCHREDRGDGALIIVPASTPTSAVINAAVVHLAPRLYQHNLQARHSAQIALRVAVSVGPVMSDPNGVSGHAINQAARLIEAKTLKAQIKANSADLGLVASAFVYETVISPNFSQNDLSHYRRFKFRAKGAKETAWMYLSNPENRG